ncbi:hypothetical protein U1Q18_025301, partial [Sarracenia purpurea var. burkii]
AKKSEEEIEGWIKVGKGKGKASEVQSGGKFPESPSTSGCQREEGTSPQVAEVEEKEASMEEESAQEVYPVQEAKDLGAKEVQIAVHCLAVNHSDSEEGMLGSEGGATDIIIDEFDRPVVNPKGPPDKKNSSSKKKKKKR